MKGTKRARKQEGQREGRFGVEEKAEGKEGRKEGKGRGEDTSSGSVEGKEGEAGSNEKGIKKGGLGTRRRARRERERKPSVERRLAICVVFYDNYKYGCKALCLEQLVSGSRNSSALLLWLRGHLGRASAV